MTIHWGAVEQYFPVMFVFSFHPFCNFGKFVSILDLARSDRVNISQKCCKQFNILVPEKLY